MSANVPMSASQIETVRSFDLSVPAAARCLSMLSRISRVCSRTLAFGSSLTCPAR